MVLTRDDREKLLLNWGYTFDDIVTAIRSNIKAKNQRRQTVTNLGKVERLEEAFESASRKLKRMILLRRSTAEEVKQMQEQADLAASALESLKIAEDRALSEIATSGVPTEQEPDDDQLANLDVQVAVSDFCRHSQIRSASFTHSQSDEFDGSTIDGLSTLDGISFGNSMSPSVLEMEKFYRELELEMFGDEPPPSMVGQTLELPVQLPVQVSEVPNDDLDSSIGLIKPGQVSMSTSPGMVIRHGDPSRGYVVDFPRRDVPPKGSDWSMISGCLETYEEDKPRYPQYIQSTDPMPVGNRDREQPRHPHEHDGFDQTHYPVHVTPDTMDEQLQNARLSSSLDSAHIDHRYNMRIPHQPHPAPQHAAPTNAIHHVPYHHQQHPKVHNNRLLPTGFNARIEDFGRLAVHYASCGADLATIKKKPPKDEPVIRHIPPPSYSTASHWMEVDDRNVSSNRIIAPVTITEDSYSIKVGNQRSNGGPSVGYIHGIADTPRYPASFY